MKFEILRKLGHVASEAKVRVSDPIGQKYSQELAGLHDIIRVFQTSAHPGQHGEMVQQNAEIIASFVEDYMIANFPEITIKRTRDNYIIATNLIDPETKKPGRIIYAPQNY